MTLPLAEKKARAATATTASYTEETRSLVRTHLDEITNELMRFTMVVAYSGLYSNWDLYFSSNPMNYIPDKCRVFH